MIIVKDFGTQSLYETNELVKVLSKDIDLIIINGVNINAKHVRDFSFNKGPCESCVISLHLSLCASAGSVIDVEVESSQFIAIEKYYDEIEKVLEIEIRGE